MTRQIYKQKRCNYYLTNYFILCVQTKKVHYLQTLTKTVLSANNQ